MITHGFTVTKSLETMLSLLFQTFYAVCWEELGNHKMKTATRHGQLTEPCKYGA